MDDVLMHLARIASLTIRSGADTKDSHHIKDDQLEDLIIRQHYFHNETVHDIISRHRGDKKYLAVDFSTPLSEVLPMFAHGVQRMCVTKNSKIVGILSQFAIIKWLSEDTSRLGDTENEPAEELGLPWDKLVKLSKEMLFIDGIEVLHDKGVQAAPILDESGKLVAHVSMTDVKALALNDIEFKDLLLPIYQFVSRVRTSQNLTPDHIVSANYKAPFKEIVQLLTTAHVHQCYLKDDQGTPVSMISLTHVCQRIFQYSPSTDRKHQQRRLST